MNAKETFELAQELYGKIEYLSMYERMAVLDMLKTIDVIYHNEHHAAEMAKFDKGETK